MARSVSAMPSAMYLGEDDDDTWLCELQRLTTHWKKPLARNLVIETPGD
jgi:hypothetical protein